MVLILKGRERKKNLCCLGFVLVAINTTKTGTNRSFVPVASDINYYNLFVLDTPVLGNHQAAENTAPRESHPLQVLCRLLSLPVTVLSRSDYDGAGVSLVVLEECIFFCQSTCTFGYT